PALPPGPSCRPRTRHCLSVHASAPTPAYTLSLHDALPICLISGASIDAALWIANATDPSEASARTLPAFKALLEGLLTVADSRADRKSTRLNSSHVKISYAVFCLKKEKLAGQIADTGDDAR